MAREITKAQERVYELRTTQRLSFEQIGRALNITRQSAYEHYARALKHVERYQRELGAELGTPLAQLDRTGEIEFLDATIRRYMQLAEKAEDRSPRSAAEILNGAARWYETLIKIKGMNAPIQVHHTITNTALEAELVKLKSELLTIDSEAQEIE